MHNRTRGKLLRRNVSAIWAQCGRNMGAMWVVGKVRTGQTLTSFAWTDYYSGQSTMRSSGRRQRLRSVSIFFVRPVPPHRHEHDDRHKIADRRDDEYGAHGAEHIGHYAVHHRTKHAARRQRRRQHTLHRRCAGYLGVLLEVEQTGRPARAAATSFAGASLPAPQAACLSAALLKLQFARASTTRLLQRRYYLGGGAPPVEPPIPEQPTAADLASSLRALGDLGAQCPTLAPQPPAALAAWGAQVVVGPEGEPAWRWSEPTLPPDADACLSRVIGRLRLPATQTASTVVLSLSCAGTGCNLAGSMTQKPEIVE